jgi:DNA-binding HxlR family transcriptional regulator
VTQYGPRSYGDFLAAIPLISRTMLSERLKELATAGVVHPDALVIPLKPF